MVFFIPIFCAGDPSPQVTWWRDSHLIDSSYEASYSRTVQNGLSLKDLSRAELGAQLTCQASNNNLSLPVSSRVTIDMKCEFLCSGNRCTEMPFDGTDKNVTLTICHSITVLH